MKCLIIAAGEGTRLSDRFESKPLIPVLGIPLIERVITTAKTAGCQEFFVVTGFNGEKVRPFLDDLSDRLVVQINHIINEEYKKPNGLSVLKAKGKITGRFILSMCDHLYDGDLLKRFKDMPINDGEACLAVDFNMENPLVDLEDVTKVEVKGEKIKKIGKFLKKYNAFDTGVFLCTQGIFQALEKSMVQKGDYSLSGGIQVLADMGKMKAFDINRSFWLDVDNGAALDLAEKYLSKRG